MPIPQEANAKFGTTTILKKAPLSLNASKTAFNT